MSSFLKVARVFAGNVRTLIFLSTFCIFVLSSAVTGYIATERKVKKAMCDEFWECPDGQRWIVVQCSCVCTTSPILIDTTGNGFALTDASNGIDFDMLGGGKTIRVAWTVTNSDDAFLCYDRNGNGKVDDGTELFGDYTPQPPSKQPNGFLALAVFDSPVNGGNGDGVIDKSDLIFSSLGLWKDLNHNGVSEQSELYTLPSLGVDSLDLKYIRSRREDRFGNEFLYKAKVYGTKDLGRWATDVFLVRG